MDFLDPSNKRSYNTRLFIGFFLSALVIVLGTLILSLITSGYTISSKTGQVIQNGLIFLDSSPTSATVYVNHQSSGATNTRLELGAANYNISLYAPGYNTWTTNLSLLGGNVEDLTYPLLIPIKPVISSIAEYPTKPEVFSQTPNKHWLLVSDPTLANSFKVYDQTNTKTAITTSTIPSNLLVSTAGPNVFTAIQWASDNQHILLQDEYNGAINFIVFNYLTPTDSYNLNQTFPISFTSAKLLNF
ncbi:MAG TPA: PEGA domain-containing protein, partial [Candidatus Dormibacteraeota bacterium]|nr:PEGA domain-containing protein [Candidatus Dormibacteraeota bacterium]